jgi:hypothetical protein
LSSPSHPPLSFSPPLAPLQFSEHKSKLLTHAFEDPKNTQANDDDDEDDDDDGIQVIYRFLGMVFIVFVFQLFA